MREDRSERSTDTRPPPDGRVLVVGDRLAVGVANRLTDRYGTVLLLVSDDRDRGKAADGVEVLSGDPADVARLRSAAGEADAVVVVTDHDGRNLLRSRLADGAARTEVVTLVQDPDNVEPFREAGVRPICVTEAVTAGLIENLDRAGLGGA